MTITINSAIPTTRRSILRRAMTGVALATSISAGSVAMTASPVDAAQPERIEFNEDCVLTDQEQRVVARVAVEARRVLAGTADNPYAPVDPVVPDWVTDRFESRDLCALHTENVARELLEAAAAQAAVANCYASRGIEILMTGTTDIDCSQLENTARAENGDLANALAEMAKFCGIKS